MSNKRNVVTTNLVWRMAERCGAQGVSFIVSIILARLLIPDDYGVVALLNVFISILNVFVDSGLGNALIQKKDADDVDFSSVFYFNILWCFLLYFGLFMAAPFVANFYDEPQLTSLTRIAGLALILSGIKNVQQAYVSRKLQFKKFFLATIGGTIGSAVLGIFMAYKGFGAWSLVVQNLSNMAVDTFILWLVVDWRPIKVFSFNRLKGLFSYGWKLLVSSLLETVYNNVRQLIIGKMYSTSDLAYYNKGKSWPNLIVTNINSSIDSVLLPVLSNEQSDMKRVKNMTRRSIQISSYIMWPMMIGLAVCAKPLVALVLTDKWLLSVPYLQLFCINYAFWPVHTANLNAIKAVGRSDIFLKLELIKKIVGILSILISMPFGVRAMAVSYTMTSPIFAIINAYPNQKLLNYTLKEQWSDLIPPVVLSILMGILIYPIQFLKISSLMILLIQILVGVILYVVLSVCTRQNSFMYIFEMFKNMKNRIL